MNLSAPNKLSFPEAPAAADTTHVSPKLELTVTRPSIAIVSPYGKHSQPLTSKADTGLNWYTSELAFELSALANVQIIAPFSDGRCWRDGDVEVIEAFKRGSRLAAFQIMVAALKSATRTIGVQHELFAFGGPVSAVTLPIALRLLRLFGRRIVTTIHGVVPLPSITREFVRNNGSRLSPTIARLGWRRLVRSVCSSSMLVVVHDEVLRRLLIEQYGVKQRIELVPLGVGSAPLPDRNERLLARRFLGIPANAEVLTFFGYFAGYKGLEPLLRAAPLLLEQRPNLYLVLAGDVPDRLAASSPLGKQAATLASAHTRVQYLGFVPEQEIRPVFAATDALILPYTTVISASGPLALAGAHGTPVLVSHLFPGVGGQPFTFNPNVEGISSAVQSFFDSAGVREASREYVLRLREECSWHSVAKRMLALYNHE